MSETFGIDVSLYQKGFDFKKAAVEGAKFVIIKASENDFKDPEFENHYLNSGKAGLSRGAYHYLCAADVSGAVKEARVFLNAVSGKKFEYPLFVDVEHASMRKLSKEAAGKVISAFCSEVEAAGYWCGFYCNYDFYSNVLNGAELAKRYSLWLASWSETCPTDCQIWQFGGEVNLKRKNVVAGVVCDQNSSFRDFTSLIGAKGLNLLKSAAVGGTSSVKEVTKKTSKENAKGAKDTSKTGTISFKVGDRVKMKDGAPIYDGGGLFAKWVYGTALYVREISGSRVVVSTQKNGAVTGAVDVKYLTLYNG